MLEMLRESLIIFLVFVWPIVVYRHMEKKQEKKQRIDEAKEKAYELRCRYIKEGERAIMREDIKKKYEASKKDDKKQNIQLGGRADWPELQRYLSL